MDSIVPWAFRCRAHTPTECSRMSEAVLCRCGWRPGCLSGWNSTPLLNAHLRPIHPGPRAALRSPSVGRLAPAHTRPESLNSHVTCRLALPGPPPAHAPTRRLFSCRAAHIAFQFDLHESPRGVPFAQALKSLAKFRLGGGNCLTEGIDLHSHAPRLDPLLGQDDGRHRLPVHQSSVQGEDWPLQGKRYTRQENWESVR